MKKFNFKKVTALAGSLLLTGATMGIAAAANYPAPFVSGGSANVAIVYGTGAGVSSLDLIQAGNIQTDLQTYLGTGSSTGGSSVSGGDSYKLEKTSTKFNLGDYAGNVVSTSITDDNLPVLLADGKYVDDDNDEFDFTQTMSLNNASLRLTMFEDNDYKADVPTVGIDISNGANVLNYTLDFTEDPLWSDLTTTDLNLMGKKYYVLSTATNTTINLLDTAESTLLSEGESATADGKEVSIAYISSTEVKLTVDGQTTNSLAEGQTQKLADGSYVGIKDILYDAKDAGISKVEFSIGTGKLVLKNATDVELNEESVSDLSAIITNSGSGATEALSSIKIIWDASDDLFVTEDSEVTMPGFEAVKLTFGGLTYPAEEAISVEANGDSAITLKNFPLKDSTESIDLLYFNTTNYTIVGKDSSNILVTSGNTSLRFDGDTDDWFTISWNDTQDSESYLMRFTNFKNESSTQKATVQYRSNGAWADVKVDAQPTNTVTLGNVEFTISSLDKDTKVAIISATGTGMSFNRLYSKEGMAVSLPWLNQSTKYFLVDGGAALACSDVPAATFSGSQLGYSIGLANITDTGTNITCSYYPSSYSLIMNEQDRNGNLDAGNTINITLGDDTNNEVSVTAVDMGAGEGTFTEQDDTNVFRNFAYSELATEALWDKSADQYKLALTYHGDEVTADVYLTSPDATVTTSPGASALGDVLVKDTEISSVATKNLVVVGGSCINSAAASLVGGAYCGAMFTEKTGVGSGQFVIKGYSGSTITSKMALLVAGYEAADTVNAATYLRTQKPDTSQAWVGTSSSSATLQVA